MTVNSMLARFRWQAYKPLTAKQLVAKLAWGLVVVANVVGSFLVVLFVHQQFRDADKSYVGNTLGVEALAIWLLFEAVVLVGLAAWAVVKRERGES